VINCDLTVSSLPAMSAARYFTVVVALTVNGAVYVEPELEFGFDPSVEYRIRLTPDPVSVALSETVTALEYVPAHGEPLQLIVVVGAVVSIWTSCDLTPSAPSALDA
jgi:hypothetical protein